MEDIEFPQQYIHPGGVDQLLPPLNKKPEQHAWSDDIKSDMKILHKLDDFHGIFEVVYDWAIIILAVVMDLRVQQFLEMISNNGYFPLIFARSGCYLFAVFLIGCRQRALADVLHQATHHVLCADKNLNYVLGSYFSGWLVFQSFSGYRKSHVLKHHPYLGDPEVDPDYKESISHGICGKDRKPANVLKYMLSLFSPVNWFVYSKYLLEHRILPEDEDMEERKPRMIFISITIITLVCCGGLNVLLWYWLVPLITAQTIIGAFCELLEHYPMIDFKPEDPKRKKKEIKITRNRNCRPLESFFLSFHADGFHLVHHLFPRLPSWNYAAAHQVLLRDEEYAELHSKQGPADLCTLLAELLNVYPEPEDFSKNM